MELGYDRVLSGCRVFCWAGEEERKELEEGNFEFEMWKKYFQGSVMRQHD